MTPSCLWFGFEPVMSWDISNIEVPNHSPKISICLSPGFESSNPLNPGDKHKEVSGEWYGTPILEIS